MLCQALLDNEPDQPRRLGRRMAEFLSNTPQGRIIEECHAFLHPFDNQSFVVSQCDLSGTIESQTSSMNVMADLLGINVDQTRK